MGHGTGRSESFGDSLRHSRLANGLAEALGLDGIASLEFAAQARAGWADQQARQSLPSATPPQPRAEPSTSTR